MSVSIRLSLGILVILNGPANALALVTVSPHVCPCAAPHASELASPKKCCGRCAKDAPSKGDGKKPAPKDEASKIRPTCPACPSCPHYPGGCCLSCPLKAPCAPPLVFAMPEAPEIVWRLTDEGISLSDSRADEVLLPPRSSQFVAFTI